MTSPIIETNVEKIIEEHTPLEIRGLEDRILTVELELKSLKNRKNKLIDILEAAGVEHDFLSEDV